MADAQKIENVSLVKFVVHRCDNWKCRDFLCIVPKHVAPYMRRNRDSDSGAPCVSKPVSSHDKIKKKKHLTVRYIL
jgi:hypothetical protein